MLNTMKKMITCYYVACQEKKSAMFFFNKWITFSVQLTSVNPPKICESNEVKEVNFQGFGFRKVFCVKSMTLIIFGDMIIGIGWWYRSAVIIKCHLRKERLPPKIKKGSCNTLEITR